MCATRIPVFDDMTAELKHFETVESASIKLFNTSLDSVKAEKMTPDQFDEIVQKQILPPWNAEKAALSKLRLADQQRSLANQFIQYMTLRGDGWAMLGEGFRKDDSNLVQQANDKQKQAEAIVNSMK